MVTYIKEPVSVVKGKYREIFSFNGHNGQENIDWETVNSFGEEWAKFNSFSEEEIRKIGDEYFDILPKELLNNKTYVLDVGCGTGRWTRYISDKVGFVESIDPSNSVLQADILLSDKKNVRISQASVDNIPFADDSFDLVFSLGVLHHIPDTEKALQNCVKKVKPGGYILIYLYYSLDNRGTFFKILFFLSNILRRLISGLPQGIKSFACDILAVMIYLPFVFLARITDRIAFLKAYTKKIPLSYYRIKSFNIIRNDALDRFGTPLEQRFSKKQIQEMMITAGLKDITFSNNEPYWHVVGRKNNF